MTAPLPRPGPELTPLDEMAGRLRLVTGRLARQLRRHTGPGLTPSQHSALACVDTNGPLTLGRLAKLEQVSPPTITRIVDRLEQDRLVARSIDPADRRHARVQITATGRQRMADSRSRRDAWLAERLQGVEPDQRRHLEAALPVLESLTAATDDDLLLPAGRRTPAGARPSRAR